MLEVFRPLIVAAQGLDLQQAGASARELTRRFDPKSAAALKLNDELLDLFAAGKIAERGAAPLRYGRAAKAGPETQHFSIDVVHMSGPGPRHKHPNGEINYCVAVAGTPTFVGRSPGWVVEPPQSEHTPSVENGTMLIVYLLPGGAIEFQQA